MKTTHLWTVITGTFLIAGVAGAAGGAGGASGTGSSAGTSATGAMGSPGATTSGSVSSPNAQTTGSSANFERGDSAPRSEPGIREDSQNTAPRVAPAPADQGGAGATSVQVGDNTVPGGTLPTGTLPSGTVNTDGTTPATIGDRDATLQPNGTAGSRKPTRRTTR